MPEGHPPLRVLIAEDNHMNQMLMTRLLQQLGHFSDVAQSGFEVLTMIERQNYDLIFMDVQMPELDGIETTKRIRSNPAFAVRPMIIALTANRLDRTRVACLEAGMNDFLTKPISINDIKAALEHRPTERLLTTEHELFRRLDELLLIGDLPFVRDLIEFFTQDGGKQLQGIDDAIGNNDFITAQKISHMLKGSASNLGASEFRNLCAVVQEASERLDGAMALAALHQAKTEFVHVQKQLAQWMEGKEK